MKSDCISVVMPAYNAEKYVAKAVQSILNQTYENFELIITDDCSTDETFSILQSITDSRVKLYQNDANSGVSFTLNNCINKSHGHLIAVMHADDISLPDRLQKQKLFLDQHTNVDAVGCNCLYINDDDKIVNERFFQAINNEFDLTCHTILKGIPFFHPSVMYRKRAVESAGCYSLEFDRMEDHDLWLRMVRQGSKLANLRSTLLKYRLHNAQLSQNVTPLDHYNTLEVYKDFLKSVGVNKSQLEIQTISKLCERGFQNISLQEFQLLEQTYFEVLEGLRPSRSDKKKLGLSFYKKILYKQSRKGKMYYIALRGYLKALFGRPDEAEQLKKHKVPN